ncbi:hypothetical protein H0H93_003303 [Arthromyces matolae]|nr:hypothetical protein H0H93_003303 [Arthromyces matolae]
MINNDYTTDEPIETAYDGQTVFDYVFVPLPGLDTSLIIERLDATSTTLEEHHFPYTSMPILRLQVQPQYVVFDLYRKILKHEGNVTTSIRKEEGYRPYFLQYSEADSLCRGIYGMWITWNVPPTFTEAGHFTDEGMESPPQLRLGAHCWPVDEVGLRPTDSATYIPGAANDDDDDDDDLVADETDSVFKARLTHWVTTLPPALAPDSQLTPLADTFGFMDDELSQSDAESPTMVGSVSSDISMKATPKNRPTSPTPLDSSLVSA